MAITDDADLADRMRMMSLHGLSQDAWDRYSGGRSWDYRIVAPGYKYNLTDVAAAIGIHQLARAEAMRLEREAIARRYLEALRGRRGDRAAARRPGSHPLLAPLSDPAAARAARRSTATPSSTSSRTRASAARCTGGRCTSTPTTRRRSAGGRRICPVATAVWERLDQPAALSRACGRRRSRTSSRRSRRSVSASTRGRRCVGRRAEAWRTSDGRAPDRSGARDPAGRRGRRSRRAAWSVSLPVLAVAAILVRATSRGPACLPPGARGPRGQAFTLYKLRTMRRLARRARR